MGSIVLIFASHHNFRFLLPLLIFFQLAGILKELGYTEEMVYKFWLIPYILGIHSQCELTPFVIIVISFLMAIKEKGKKKKGKRKRKSFVIIDLCWNTSMYDFKNMGSNSSSKLRKFAGCDGTHYLFFQISYVLLEWWEGGVGAWKMDHYKETAFAGIWPLAEWWVVWKEGSLTILFVSRQIIYTIQCYLADQTLQ